MEGWIKLYRKILENDLFFDEKAFRVFIYFLLMADRKGSLRISRYRTAEHLQMNPNAFREVVGRLVRNYEVITKSSTNKYSTIQILNWGKYQVSAPTRTPTGHQQNTTYTRKKEYKKETGFFKIKPMEGHIPYEPPRS